MSRGIEKQLERIASALEVANEQNLDFIQRTIRRDKDQLNRDIENDKIVKEHLTLRRAEFLRDVDAAFMDRLSPHLEAIINPGKSDATK